MVAKTAKLSSAELLDYEAQLTRDELAPEAAAEIRDAALRERTGSSTDRNQILRSWLYELRKDEGLVWPSMHFLRIYGSLVALALLGGLGIGVALMQGLLSYSGEQPVNVLPFLAIFVVLQIVLLLLYALRSLVGKFAKKSFRGIWVNVLRDLGLRLVSRHFQQVEGQGAFVRAYVLRIRRLHSELVECYLWKIVQIFGISCFTAALFTFLANISVYDYSFGWSSTLSYQAGVFHRLLETLAFPFRWIGAGTVPSLELIEASQFSRFERAFADPRVSSRETGAWWPFLACCIAFYSLLPRLILLGMFESRIHSILARLPFDDFMSVGLLQRLTRPPSHWTTDAADGPGLPARNAADLMTQRSAQAAIVVRWRDCPFSDDEIRGFFAKHSGHQLLAIIDAVGRSADGARISSELDRAGAREVLIVCDPWELPGEAIERLRQQLRQRPKGEVRMVFVPLARKDGALELKGDKAAWRFAIGAYRDPYLGLFSSAVQEVP